MAETTAPGSGEMRRSLTLTGVIVIRLLTRLLIWQGT